MLIRVRTIQHSVASHLPHCLLRGGHEDGVVDPVLNLVPRGPQTPEPRVRIAAAGDSIMAGALGVPRAESVPDPIPVAPPLT